MRAVYLPLGQALLYHRQEAGYIYINNGGLIKGLVGVAYLPVPALLKEISTIPTDK